MPVLYHEMKYSARSKYRRVYVIANKTWVLAETPSSKIFKNDLFKYSEEFSYHLLILLSKTWIAALNKRQHDCHPQYRDKYSSL